MLQAVGGREAIGWLREFPLPFQLFADTVCALSWL